MSKVALVLACLAAGSRGLGMLQAHAELQRVQKETRRIVLDGSRYRQLRSLAEKRFSNSPAHSRRVFKSLDVIRALFLASNPAAFSFSGPRPFSLDSNPSFTASRQAVLNVFNHDNGFSCSVPKMQEDPTDAETKRSKVARFARNLFTGLQDAPDEVGTSAIPKAKPKQPMSWYDRGVRLNPEEPAECVLSWYDSGVRLSDTTSDAKATKQTKDAAEALKLVAQAATISAQALASAAETKTTAEKKPATPAVVSWYDSGVRLGDTTPEAKAEKEASVAAAAEVTTEPEAGGDSRDSSETKVERQKVVTETSAVEAEEADGANDEDKYVEVISWYDSGVRLSDTTLEAQAAKKAKAAAEALASAAEEAKAAAEALASVSESKAAEIKAAEETKAAWQAKVAADDQSEPSPDEEGNVDGSAETEGEIPTTEPRGGEPKMAVSFNVDNS